MKKIGIILLALTCQTAGYAATSVDDYKSRDDELNFTYQSVLKNLNKTEKDKLFSSELKWIKFRDATCEFESQLLKEEHWSKEENIDNQLSSCMSRLTESRTSDLKRYLKITKVKPPKGVVTNDSKCFSYYHDKMAKPLIEPTDVIRAHKGSDVYFGIIGGSQAQEDPTTISVNGKIFHDGDSLPLILGENVVDFFIIGEGEVHNWHVFLKIDDKIVFEQKQERMPAFSCDDELYRYRMYINVE